jgi:hypothetical protein
MGGWFVVSTTKIKILLVIHPTNPAEKGVLSRYFVLGMG